MSGNKVVDRATEKGLGAADRRPAPPGGATSFRACYALPILNILVPQTGQTPCVAALPFFIVIALALLISLLALHFTQYACIVESS